MTESPITSISPVIDIINNNSTTTQNRRFSNFNIVHNCLAEHLHVSPYVVAELLRTLISFISLVISAFVCTFAIQWSDLRWINYNKDMDPLEDLAFSTPKIDYVFLADIAMLTLLVGSLVINMVLAASNIARIIILRRIFWLLSFLLIFRGITIGVTVLPSPKQCAPLNTAGNFLNMLKTSCYLIVGSVKACTDNMYSGHSTFITLSVILLRIYCRYKLIVYYSYLHGLVALCLLIATRIHYTVDVIIAVFVTYSTHSIYYFIVDICFENHFLRIKRTEDIIGDKELYQRIVYVPNMFNTSLFGVIRWMDGLDIRFRHEAEKIRDINSGQSRPNNYLANEMIQIEVSHSPNEDEPSRDWTR